MSRRKRLEYYQYEYAYVSFWMVCSIDFKQKLLEYVSDHDNVKISAFPIVFHGVRYFSLYKLQTGDRTTNMLIVTKTGLDQLNILCERFKTEREIYYIINKYFSYHLKRSHLEELLTIRKILPSLVHNYYQNRYSRYIDSSILNGNYLCITYPMEILRCKVLNNIIKKIQEEKDVLLRDYYHVDSLLKYK